MRLEGCEFCLAVEFTINDNVDVVAELVDLSIASDFKSARVRDGS